MYNNEYSVCPCCRNMVRRHEGRFGLGGGFGHGFRHGLEHGYNQYDREDRRDVMKYRCCPNNREDREVREIRHHREDKEDMENREEKEARENYYFNSYYNRENYEEPKHEDHKKSVVVLFYWNSCGHCHVMINKENGSFGNIKKLHQEHPELQFVKIETDELKNGYTNSNIDPVILDKIKEVGKDINAFPELKLFTKVGNEVVVHKLENRHKFAEEAKEKLRNGANVSNGSNSKRENYQEKKKKVVLLYANWCPHCKTLLQKEQPGQKEGKWFDLNKLKQEYPGFDFYKYEQNEFNNAPKDVQKCITDETGKSLIRGFPTVLVIGENGNCIEVDRNLKNLN